MVNTVSIRITKVLFVVTALFMTLFFTGCGGDDDDATPSYPRTVAISYKVTSPSGVGAATVSYTNETGGMSTLANQSLPFTVSFNRAVDRYDALGLGFNTNVGGSIKLEILVDGQVVETTTETSNTPDTGSITYLFQ